MATFLFDEIIFGPVKSRRLGISLGINLLPTNQKICSFDCIYCECGVNTKAEGKPLLPSREEVKQKLAQKLASMQSEGQLPDVITFAGNGEPTLHPEFAGIVEDTIALRQMHCPDARVAVLSNASHLGNEKVRQALMMIDDNILKLDSGIESSIKAIDRPNGTFDLGKLIDHLKWFNGKLIIQTLFLQGTVNGVAIDNTSEADIAAWLKIVDEVHPKSVMIYTISRDTPFETLRKVPLAQLNAIAQKIREIGFDAQVSG